MPVVIRVSSAAQELISHVDVARAIGFIKAKARQLTPIMWREAERRRNNLPNRTFYYAMPGTAIGTIELKTNPREQSWHARIIGGSLPAGILAWPRNVDDEFGWIAPFEDPDAIPPIELPGTPNDANEDGKRGVFRLQGAALTYIRDQDFRLFESDALVDWRSFQIPNPDVDGGQDFEILHFHAFTRYFPTHNDTGIQDSTLMRNFFYDKTGTVKVPGPTPVVSAFDLIQGVALRFLDDDTKPTEYVCAIGRFPLDDMEFFAKDRDDPMDDWRHIGSIPAAFYDAQLDNGVMNLGGSAPSSGFYTFDDIPINFNRRGTRACKMLFSGFDAADGRNVPYLLEVVVNDEDITHSLTRQDTPLARTIGWSYLTENTSETTVPPDPIPTCPASYDSVTETNGSATRDFQSNAAQLNVPIAVDYKIGSDTELGFIKMSQTVDQTSASSVVTESTSTVHNICNPFFPFGDSSSGSSTSVDSLTSVDLRTVSFSMDGGRAVFTLGPFRISNGSTGFSYGVSRTITTVTSSSSPPSVFSLTGTQTASLGNDPKEARIPTFSMAQVEIAGADIRYGSMTVKERFIHPEGFEFNTTLQEYDPFPVQPSSIPSGGNPQVVGPVENGPANQPSIAIAGAGGGFGSPSYATWGRRNVGIIRTHVRAEGVNDSFEAIDPRFYAIGTITGGGPEIFQSPYRYQIIDRVPILAVPGEVVENDLGAAAPGLVAFDQFRANHIRFFPQASSIGTRSVHDRNGKFFYNIDLPGSDNQRYFTVAGPIFRFATDFDYTSYSSYQNQDPTVPVEMPLNEALGAQGTEDNTTRPLFYALVAVQNATIPGEVTPPVP